MWKEKIETKEMNRLIKNTNKILQVVYALVLLLFVLLLTYLVKEWNILSFLGTLIGVISPVFIGFLLAWLLDPVATKLSEKMPRIIACIVTYLIIFLIFGFILTLLIPAFTDGVGDVVSTLPDIVEGSQDVTNNFFEKFEENDVIMDYKDDILDKIEVVGKDISKTLPDLVIGFGKGFFGIGANLILGIMIGFYLLFDFRKTKSHFLSLIPDKWHENAKDLMMRINGKLRSYVQGVFLVMFLVFVTQAIGLTLAGLKAPILFAFFCAVTDIIPYIGPWIGGIPAVLVGFTVSPTVGFLALISIFVCQLLENNFYQPLIMGKTMKLHPVTVMLGLLIFNYFFGMIGMIVATPVIATLKIIFEFLEEKTGIVKKYQQYQKEEGTKPKTRKSKKAPI